MRRLLLHGDQPVRLGSRALEILIALVERPGELVGKNELMARVWPRTFVEDGNLKVQVAGLRRALGDRRGSNRYLATNSRAGLSLCRSGSPHRGAKSGAAGRRSAHAQSASASHARDRPQRQGGALPAQLLRCRFITIVGPGGIGKSTVALAVAEGLIEGYDHGVRFVDLAQIRDPLQVLGALVDALGLEIRSDDPIPELIAPLQGKAMLLVLDNCEHVIETTAPLAARILKGRPGRPDPGDQP